MSMSLNTLRRALFGSGSTRSVRSLLSSSSLSSIALASTKTLGLYQQQRQQQQRSSLTLLFGESIPKRSFSTQTRLLNGSGVGESKGSLASLINSTKEEEVPSVTLTRKHDNDRVTVTFLGTSSGHPAKNRNVSSVTLRFEDECIVFDGGEGTQYRIQQAEIPFYSISTIFVTHLHGDHCGGLPSLIKTILHVRSCVGLDRFPRPLKVFGPPGILALVSSFYKIDESRLEIHEFLCPQEETHVMHETDKWRVSTARLRHTVPCQGYVWQEKTPSGNGVKVVVLGDTSDSTDMIPIATNCDALLHECTLSDNLAKEAVIRGHSTPWMAGSFAKKIRAKRLYLTHFGIGSEYQAESADVDKTIEELQRRASVAFGSKKVFIAVDLRSFALARHQQP